MKQCTFLSDAQVPLIFVTFLNLKCFFPLKHHAAPLGKAFPAQLATPGYFNSRFNLELNLEFCFIFL